jgi:hypothetical protein
MLHRLIAFAVSEMGARRHGPRATIPLDVFRWYASGFDRRKRPRLPSYQSLSSFLGLDLLRGRRSGKGRKRTRR